MTGLALAAAVALVSPLEAPASIACFEVSSPPSTDWAPLTLSLSADTLTFDGDQIDARAVVVSGCACAGQAWRVRATRLRGEREALARVDWPVLYLGAVPVAAAPVWWVPLGERVPGFLFPRARLRGDGAVVVEQRVFVPIGRAVDVSPAVGIDSSFGLTGGVTTRWRTPQSAERIETVDVHGSRQSVALVGDAVLGGGGANLAARGETLFGRDAAGRAALPQSVVSQPRLSAELAAARSTPLTHASLGVVRAVGPPEGRVGGERRHSVQATASATTHGLGGYGHVDAALLADAEGKRRAAFLWAEFERQTGLGLTRWTPTVTTRAGGDDRAALQASAGAHLLGEASAEGSPGGVRHRLTVFGGGSVGAASARYVREGSIGRSPTLGRRSFLGVAQQLGTPSPDAALQIDAWWARSDTQAASDGPGGRAQVSLPSASVGVLAGLDTAHARAQGTWQPLTAAASYLWSRAGAARPETLDPRAPAPWTEESAFALMGASIELGVTTQRWRARYTVSADTLAERARIEAQSASLTWNALCECLSIGAAVEHSRGLAAPDVRLSLSGRL